MRVAQSKPLIVVADPIADGHHPAYLRMMAEAFKVNGADVVLVGPEGALPKSPQPHQVWQLTWAPSRGRLALRRQTVSWLQTLGRHLDRIEAAVGRSIALIFISYLDLFMDKYLIPLDWRRTVGRRQFSGLIFHGDPTEVAPLRRWRRGPLAPWGMLHSRLCPAVATLNECGAAALGAFLGHERLLVFPDVAQESAAAPATDSPLLQEVRARAGGRSKLVLLGALDSRKGLPEFLRIAERLSTKSWFLVCAGMVYEDRLPAETKALLARARSGDFQNLHVYDHWLTDAEFDGLVHSASAIFAAYRGFYGSSNLLTRAAQAEKPVLVSDGSLMARRVRRYRTGLAVPEGDVPAMVDLLSAGRLLSLAATQEFSDGCRRYRLEHSFERLADVVGLLLAACRIPR